MRTLPTINYLIVLLLVLPLLASGTGPSDQEKEVSGIHLFEIIGTGYATAWSVSMVAIIITSVSLFWGSSENQQFLYSLIIHLFATLALWSLCLSLSEWPVLVERSQIGYLSGSFGYDPMSNAISEATSRSAESGGQMLAHALLTFGSIAGVAASVRAKMRTKAELRDRNPPSPPPTR